MKRNFWPVTFFATPCLLACSMVSDLSSVDGVGRARAGFEALGLSVTEIDGHLAVSSVVPGSLSDRAGVTQYLPIVGLVVVTPKSNDLIKVKNVSDWNAGLKGALAEESLQGIHLAFVVSERPDEKSVALSPFIPLSRIQSTPKIDAAIQQCQHYRGFPTGGHHTLRSHEAQHAGTSGHANIPLVHPNPQPPAFQYILPDAGIQAPAPAYEVPQPQYQTQDPGYGPPSQASEAAQSEPAQEEDSSSNDESSGTRFDLGGASQGRTVDSSGDYLRFQSANPPSVPASGSYFSNRRQFNQELAQSRARADDLAQNEVREMHLANQSRTQAGAYRSQATAYRNAASQYPMGNSNYSYYLSKARESQRLANQSENSATTHARNAAQFRQARFTFTHGLSQTMLQIDSQVTRNLIANGQAAALSRFAQQQEAEWQSATLDQRLTALANIITMQEGRLYPKQKVLFDHVTSQLAATQVANSVTEQKLIEYVSLLLQQYDVKLAASKSRIQKVRNESDYSWLSPTGWNVLKSAGLLYDNPDQGEATNSYDLKHCNQDVWVYDQYLNMYIWAHPPELDNYGRSLNAPWPFPRGENNTTPLTTFASVHSCRSATFACPASKKTIGCAVRNVDPNLYFAQCVTNRSKLYVLCTLTSWKGGFEVSRLYESCLTQ